MNAPNVLLPFRIEVIVEYPLAIPVDVEINASCRNNTNQVRAESSEECPEALVLVY